MDGKLADVENTSHMIWTMDGIWTERGRNIYGKFADTAETSEYDGKLRIDGKLTEN
jgi:hypothetical protein